MIKTILYIFVKKKMVGFKAKHQADWRRPNDSSLILMGTEEKIGISGGGDTNALASDPEQNGN